MQKKEQMFKKLLVFSYVLVFIVVETLCISKCGTGTYWKASICPFEQAANSVV